MGRTTVRITQAQRNEFSLNQRIRSGLSFSELISEVVKVRPTGVRPSFRSSTSSIAKNAKPDANPELLPHDQRIPLPEVLVNCHPARDPYTEANHFTEGRATVENPDEITPSEIISELAGDVSKITTLDYVSADASGLCPDPAEDPLGALDWCQREHGRTHRALNFTLGMAATIADRFQNDCDVWERFCLHEPEFWEGKRARPDEHNQAEALNFLLKFMFSMESRQTLSGWKIAIENLRKKGISPQNIEAELNEISVGRAKRGEEGPARKERTAPRLTGASDEIMSPRNSDDSAEDRISILAGRCTIALEFDNTAHAKLILKGSRWKLTPADGGPTDDSAILMTVLEVFAPQSH